MSLSVLRVARLARLSPHAAAGFASQQSATVRACGKALTSPNAARKAAPPTLFATGAALLAACGAGAALAASEGVKEPATGITFNESLGGMPLLGVGVRYKWGLVKVSIPFRFTDNYDFI